MRTVVIDGTCDKHAVILTFKMRAVVMKDKALLSLIARRAKRGPDFGGR